MNNNIIYKIVKLFYYAIILFMVLSFILLISGCQSKSTGRLYQENYDGNCFRPEITWSEMSLCLKTDRDKEWQQNLLANELSKSF